MNALILTLASLLLLTVIFWVSYSEGATTDDWLYLVDEPIKQVEWSDETEYVIIPALEYRILNDVVDRYEDALDKNDELLELNKELYRMLGEMLLQLSWE